MHSPIPRSAAAIAAGCIDYHRATRSSRYRVKIYGSAFQLESAVYSMQNVSEREYDSGVRRVQQNGYVGRCGRSGTGKDECGNDKPGS